MIWQKSCEIQQRKTESNFLHQCPAEKQFCRKDFPDVPSVHQGEHELAMCLHNKEGLTAFQTELGTVLPAS